MGKLQFFLVHLSNFEFFIDVLKQFCFKLTIQIKVNYKANFLEAGRDRSIILLFTLLKDPGVGRAVLQTPL